MRQAMPAARLFLPFLVRHLVLFVTTQRQFADLVQAFVVLIQQFSKTGAVEIAVKLAATGQRFERANYPGRSAYLGVQQVQQIEAIGTKLVARVFNVDDFSSHAFVHPMSVETFHSTLHPSVCISSSDMRRLTPAWLASSLPKCDKTGWRVVLIRGTAMLRMWITTAFQISTAR
jgi:hypothetical protein